MRHIAIFKAAQHMHNRIHFADIGKELIAQAFTLGSAAHQTRDIHEFQTGRHGFLRLANARQRIQPRIRHSNAPHIGFNGAEGVIRCLRCRSLCQRIE